MKAPPRHRHHVSRGRGWRTHGNNARTGTVENSGSPVPNAPAPPTPPLLEPQPYAAPLADRPMKKKRPPLICLKASPPVTEVGVSRGVVVPSPSCPNELTPQQNALPAASNAHAQAGPTKAAPTSIS